MRLKLLVIAPFYDHFIKDLVEAQSKYLEEIHVIVRYNPLNEFSKYLPGVRYIKHLKAFTKENLVDISNIPSNVYIHLLPVYYVLPDSVNPALGNKLVRVFYEYIIKNKLEFDVIHGHFTYPPGYVAVELGKLFNKPSVITLHENSLRHINSIKKNKRIYSMSAYAWKNADLLIRVNKRDIKWFIKHGASPERIVYIPNGYNPCRLLNVPQQTARHKIGVSDDQKVIFNLARLYYEKGHQYLIQAMSEVVKHRDDVYCFIGGDGPLRGKLQKQIKDLGLRDHVKLLGFIPDDKLALWYNAADLFVLPSLSEGNPTVMFEALGVGLPFVSTAVGGVPEIITSEDYGLLCPPKDPECLAEKILMALEKEWYKENIRRYAEQFTWENIALTTIEYYKKIIGEQDEIK